MPWLNSLCEAAGRVISAHRAKRKLAALLPIEQKCEAGLAAAFRQQGRLVLERFGKLERIWPIAESSLAFDSSEISGADIRVFGPSRLGSPERGTPLSGLDRRAIPKGVFSESAADEFAADFMDDTADVYAITMEAVEKPLTAAVSSALAIGIKDTIADFGADVSFDLDNPRAVSYLEEHGAALVSKIDGETRDQVQRIVTEGVRNGDSYNTTAKALSDKYEQFAVGKPQEHIDSRAHLIAVTEASHAYEKGNREGVQSLVDAGIAMEKAWIITTGNVCDACGGNAEVGWIPYEEDFPDGSIGVEDSHPACRCATEYRRAESQTDPKEGE